MTKPFDVRIGHVLDVIQDIPDESVHCCVTSPPYWGLRNYGIPDQIWGGDPDHAYADSNGARGSDKPWQPRPSADKGTFNGKTEAMAETGQNAFRAVTQMRNKRDVWTINTQPTPEAHFATYPVVLAETCILAGCPSGGTVLDPFSGAGTTGLAAIKHGRQYIGIELNPEYAKITTERTDRHAPLFA